MHLRGRRRIQAALIALVLRVAMSLASAHLLHLHDLGRWRKDHRTIERWG